jgi:hypothetical protein
MPSKRFAYAPPLLPDEPLDGWLEHIAATLDTTVAELARTCAIPTPRGTYQWVRDLSPQQIERLATATNQTPAALHAATLWRWQHLDLTPSRKSGGTMSAGPWKRGSGTRFCPECFNERSGRWRLTWYLHWTFACANHQRLLQDTCACGRVPRDRERNTLRFPLGRSDICACARQLTNSRTAVERFDDDHPIMRAQTLINRHLGAATDTGDGLRTSPVVAGIPTDGTTWFTDLTSLTRALILLAGTTSPIHLTPLMETEDQQPLDAVLAITKPPRGKNAMEHFKAATRAANYFGACAALAVDLLEADDPEHLTTRLERLAPTHIRDFRSRINRNTPSSTLARAIGGRSNLARVLKAAQTEAIRRNPNSRNLLDPCHLPARPFPNLIQQHPTLLTYELAPAAAAVALLGWPHQQSLPHCASLLGLEHLTQPLLQQWAHLTAADTNLELVNTLIDLRALLITHGNPIDYERRRHTFKEPTTLADRKVRPVAQQVGHPLTRAFVHYVSLYLHEQLSGSDALLTAQALQTPGAFRVRYRRLRQIWTHTEPPTVTALIEAALLRHRINEPLHWQPTHNNAWVITDPDYTRTLPGWNTRELRRTSRHRTPGRLKHATIEQIVQFAFDDTSTYAQSIRHMLTSAARLNLNHPTIRANQPRIANLTRLAHHTGRDLLQPTPATQPPNRTAAALALTDDGTALIAATTQRLDEAMTPSHPLKPAALTGRPQGFD